MLLSGPYDVSIDSSGSLTLPGYLSQHDYVQIFLPNEFNITLKLDNKTSRAEMYVENNSYIDIMEFANKSKIEITGVKSAKPLEAVPVQIKSPIIVVDGKIKFDKTNFYGELTNHPLDVSGHAMARFDFIDDIKEPYRNGTKIQHLSYLGSIVIDGELKQAKQEFKIPGDISADVRKRGLDVPLHSIVSSSSNIALIIAISVGTILMTLLIRRMHFYR